MTSIKVQKIVFGNKDIHSSSNVAREKMGDLSFEHVFHYPKQ
jgi:hypothetical protein